MTSQVKMGQKCSRAEEMTVRIKHLLQKLEVGSLDPQHSHKCQVDIATVCNPSTWEAEIPRAGFPQLDSESNLVDRLWTRVRGTASINRW